MLQTDPASVFIATVCYRSVPAGDAAIAAHTFDNTTNIVRKSLLGYYGATILFLGLDTPYGLNVRIADQGRLEFGSARLTSHSGDGNSKRWVANKLVSPIPPHTSGKILHRKPRNNHQKGHGAGGVPPSGLVLVKV